MIPRMLTVVVALFWVIMNLLLWRSEFGRGREGLSQVPLDTVMDRLLSAPDASVLLVRHRGETLGVLRWVPSVLEATDARPRGAAALEGMVIAVGYSLDLDLNLTGSTPSDRWRVLLHAELDTNRTWKEFSVRLFQRPATWEISAKAGDDRIRLRFEEGRNSWEQWFSPRDVRQLGPLLGPYAAFVPEIVTSGLTRMQPDQWRQAVRWEARNDWLQVGRNRMRVFRIRVVAFDRHEMVVDLSRAGEVLQVRLPDQLTLVNEALPWTGVRPIGGAP